MSNCLQHGENSIPKHYHYMFANGKNPNYKFVVGSKEKVLLRLHWLPQNCRFQLFCTISAINNCNKMPTIIMTHCSFLFFLTFAYMKAVASYFARTALPKRWDYIQKIIADFWWRVQTTMIRFHQERYQIQLQFKYTFCNLSTSKVWIAIVQIDRSIILDILINRGQLLQRKRKKSQLKHFICGAEPFKIKYQTYLFICYIEDKYFQTSWIKLIFRKYFATVKKCFVKICIKNNLFTVIHSTAAVEGSLIVQSVVTHCNDLALGMLYAVPCPYRA